MFENCNACFPYSQKPVYIFCIAQCRVKHANFIEYFPPYQRRSELEKLSTFPVSQKALIAIFSMLSKTNGIAHNDTNIRMINHNLKLNAQLTFQPDIVCV